LTAIRLLTKYIVDEIRDYVTPDGRDVFRDWHRKLRDTKAKLAVDRRIYWMEGGNFGDHKLCRDGFGSFRSMLHSKQTKPSPGRRGCATPRKSQPKEAACFFLRKKP
jgi:hypothetical protein